MLLNIFTDARNMNADLDIKLLENILLVIPDRSKIPEEPGARGERRTLAGQAYIKILHPAVTVTSFLE